MLHRFDELVPLVVVQIVTVGGTVCRMVQSVAMRGSERGCDACVSDSSLQGARTCRRLMCVPHCICMRMHMHALEPVAAGAHSHALCVCNIMRCVYVQ
jgi:hypothetical protein